MRIPRILFVVPGLLAGLLVPALQASPKSLPPGAVGMTGVDFARDVVTIHEGQRVTFFNNSNVIHTIGAGNHGKVISYQKNVPVIGFHVMQTNGVYITPPWTKPGTYFITCAVHPHMTIKIVVTR